MRAALYTRVSTKEQNTLPMQMKAVKSLARQRGWSVTMVVSEIASGRATRPERETIIDAARRRKIDLVVVWKVDRWGRNLSDLISTIEELSLLGVSLVSATESFDMTSPAGKAMVSMLSVFSNFERDMLGERIKAGIRASKKKHGRPRTALKHASKIQKLYAGGLTKSEIARKLRIRVPTFFWGKSPLSYLTTQNCTNLSR